MLVSSLPNVRFSHTSPSTLQHPPLRFSRSFFILCLIGAREAKYKASQSVSQSVSHVKPPLPLASRQVLPVSPSSLFSFSSEAIVSSSPHARTKWIWASVRAYMGSTKHCTAVWQLVRRKTWAPLRPLLPRWNRPAGCQHTHNLTDGAFQRTARLDYSGPKMEGENKKFPPTIRHSATWTGRGTYSRTWGPGYGDMVACSCHSTVYITTRCASANFL